MNRFKLEYEKFFNQFKNQTLITADDNDDGDDNGNDSELNTQSQSHRRLSDDQQQQNSIQIFNISFDIFLKYFKKFKFVHFILWMIDKQNTKFIRECFDEQTEFLIDNIAPENCLESRIFAFYVLYALWSIYHRIYPFMPFKMRLDHQSLFNVQDLINESLKSNQYDISIAYRKLVSNSAFAYCHSRILYGPYYKDYMYKSMNNNQNDDTDSTNFYKEIEVNMNNYESLLKEFENIDYNAMKQCFTDIIK